MSNSRKYLFFITQDYSFPVLRPLQKEIVAQGGEVKWFLYGDEIDFGLIGANENRLNSVAEIIAYKPVAVFVPGNVVPSFIPGLKIELFHGLPGKKTKKSGEIYHYIIRGMFDLYCTQGPESTEIFEKLSRKHRYFKVVETGWCKLDPLFEKRTEPDNKHKTIFFASTFSPRFSRAEMLYPLIYQMMREHDYQWYVTLHPKMNDKVKQLYQSIDRPNVKFVGSTELLEAFQRSDLMLCDTSSIIYEFMTQLKPVVTFQAETAEEGVVNIENLEQLEETMIGILKDSRSYSKSIAERVAKIHPYSDGQSSKRVLEAVNQMLQGNNLPAKCKPLNIVRNLKLRRELNYWKFW